LSRRCDAVERRHLAANSRQQCSVVAFVIFTLAGYVAGIGAMLLINERWLGLGGFTEWPIAWFIWSVACWPGLAAGMIARWSGVSPKAMIRLHGANAAFVIVMIEASYVLGGDTPFYITIMVEIVLVYAAISRAKK